MANRERKQTKRTVFSFVLQLCTNFTTSYLLFITSKTEKHIFEALKMYENILDVSILLLKRRVDLHFGSVVEICYYISMLFLTRRAHFGRIQSDIEL